MIDNLIRPDDPGQQKANRNLAIWIGVLGIGSFGLFYALFMALMFLQPGLMFKLMPIPMIIDTALSDGNRTYVVHQEIDMSGVTPGNQRKPEVRHVMSVLNGTELGDDVEIPAYEHASGGGNGLLFLSKGKYRTYYGGQWREERSEAIGNDPKGVSTPAGIYVLSGGESGPHLALIAAGMAADIALPGEYLAWQRNQKCPCPCEKLVWFAGKLSLFWKGDDTVSWATLDGTAWAPTVTFSHSGGYDVVADDNSLHLFRREGEGTGRRISYCAFSNGAWSPLVTLPVKGDFTDWDVFIRQGKPRLFVQQITNQTFYTVENGSLADPVRLAGPFDPKAIMKWGVLWSVGSIVVSLAAVLAVSAIIQRFKKGIWRTQDAEYRFASLSRRFCAMMIDNALLCIPPGIIIAFFFPGLDGMESNPLQFFLPIFSASALFFIGGFLYHSLLEGMYGQTLGKKLCGIRVLKADFSPCSLSSGFLRNLMRIADAFFYYMVAVISIAACLKWQRVGDIVADTVVVKEIKTGTNSITGR